MTDESLSFESLLFGNNNTQSSNGSNGGSPSPTNDRQRPLSPSGNTSTVVVPSTPLNAASSSPSSSSPPSPTSPSGHTTATTISGGHSPHVLSVAVTTTTSTTTFTTTTSTSTPTLVSTVTTADPNLQNQTATTNNANSMAVSQPQAIKVSTTLRGDNDTTKLEQVSNPVLIPHSGNIISPTFNPITSPVFTPSASCTPNVGPSNNPAQSPHISFSLHSPVFSPRNDPYVRYTPSFTITTVNGGGGGGSVGGGVVGGTACSLPSTSPLSPLSPTTLLSGVQPSCVSGDPSSIVPPPLTLNGPTTSPNIAAAAAAAVATSSNNNGNNGSGGNNSNSSGGVPKGEPNCTVVLKNLPFYMKQDALYQILARAGVQPHHIGMHYDANGMFRGMAFVKYHTVAEATKAVEVIPTIDFGGRRIKSEFKNKKSKSSAPPTIQDEGLKKIWEELVALKDTDKHMTLRKDLTREQLKQIKQMADRLQLQLVVPINGGINQIIVMRKQPATESGGAVGSSAATATTTTTTTTATASAATATPTTTATATSTSPTPPTTTTAPLSPVSVPVTANASIPTVSLGTRQQQQQQQQHASKYGGNGGGNSGAPSFHRVIVGSAPERSYMSQAASASSSNSNATSPPHSSTATGGGTRHPLFTTAKTTVHQTTRQPIVPDDSRGFNASYKETRKAAAVLPKVAFRMPEPVPAVAK